MTSTPAVLQDSLAFRKASLIHQALETLRAGHQIDERDDLDASNFLEWYDRTIPDVQDIEILAGAMKIELAKRRGERIEDEGERCGERNNLTPSVRSLSNAVMAQRSRDRVLAEHPEAVDAYVQREVRAKRAPRVKGAVRAASAARAATRPTRKVAAFRASQLRRQETNEELFATLDQVADGVRRTDAQLAKTVGVADVFLNRVRLLPWLRIDRTIEGTSFHINAALRAICDGETSCPALSYQSVHQFLQTLRAEITRKRKENRDDRQKSRWNSQLILTRVQSDLLDWIEQQLDRVPTR